VINSVYEALVLQIKRALALHGWTPLDSVCLAYRDYPTAVGTKRALTFLSDFGPNTRHLMLRGQYYSEGTNVIEADCLLIPKTADPGTLEHLVARFATAADAHVQASYAARLLRVFGVGAS